MPPQAKDTINVTRIRISDIETEITLPPLRTDNILLDLEPIAAKSYNAMQASIVVNAIDSQRTDQVFSDDIR